MPKSRIPSPARSHGPPITPRRHKPRGPRSMGSPARSEPSGSKSRLVERIDENRESLSLSPMGKSILSDNTDIEQPKRKSWWRKVENSRDVIEVLEENRALDTNNILEQYDIEIGSQQNKDLPHYLMDLPDSSGSESIHSIVMPQKKLFNERENQPPNVFKSDKGSQKLVPNKIKANRKRDDRTANSDAKNKDPKQTKPLFPAALLGATPETTFDNKTMEMVTEVRGRPRNIFGNQKDTEQKNMFADFVVSESEDEIPELRPKYFDFKKIPEPMQNTKASEIPTKERQNVQNLFKTQKTGINMFADSIVSNSDDEIPQIQPKRFAFENNRNPVRHSNTGSRGGRQTSSMIADIEMDDWNLLPSSTMIDHQLETVAYTPAKKAELSKLSEGKESDAVTTPNDKEKSMTSQNEEKHLITNMEEQNSTQNNSKVGSSNSNAGYVYTKNTDKMNNVLNQTAVLKQMEQNLSIGKNVGVGNLILEGKPLTETMEVDNQANIQYQQTSTGSDDEDENIGRTNDDDNHQEEPDDDHGNITLIFDENEQKASTVSDDEDENVTITNNDNHQEETDNEDENITLTYDENELDEGKKQESDDVNAIDNNKINNSTMKSGAVGVGNYIKVNEIHEVTNNYVNKRQLEQDCELQAEKAFQIIDKELPKNPLEINIETPQRENSLQEMNKIVDQPPETAIKQVEMNENQETETSVQIPEVNAQNISKQIEGDDGCNKDDIDHDEEMEDKQKEEMGEYQDIEIPAQILEVSAQNKQVEDSDDNNKGDSDHVEETENEQVEEGDDSDSNKGDSYHDEEVEEDPGEEMDDEQEEMEVETNYNDEETAQRDVSHNEDDENEEENTMEEADDSDKSQQDTSADSIDNDAEENIEYEEEFQDNINGDDSQEEQDNEIENLPQNENKTPDISHNTTGRNRQKNRTKSPEAILNNITGQGISFIGKGRNTSIRQTKSILKNFPVRLSLAPPRQSIDSDGTKNSSAEGSGWDSHRTTRKTLRQTFGKDFTPRKSLRALVMEKSAKRQTEINEAKSLKPQANSTALQTPLQPVDHEDTDNISPIGDEDEETQDMEQSEYEVSRTTQQAALKSYFQKITKENEERRQNIKQEIMKSFKSNPLKGNVLNRVVLMPAIRRPNPKPLNKISKAKSMKPSIIPLEHLPPDFLNDLKYKPPKRFQPSNASWITKRLYKFLETKLETRYHYKARVRAEKLVEMIYNFTRDLRRVRVAPAHSVAALKTEMARLNIVKTHHDFYMFFNNYMPLEVKYKVVPDIVNEIPLPSQGVFSDIMVQ